MECPCGKLQMIERSGVYGNFFYCKSHGTLSIQSSKIVATGEIRKTLQTNAYNKLSLQNVGRSVSDRPSLEMEMERQMLAFGVRLTEIDRFIEGETHDLQQMAALDDEDHWLNQRPY
jgi:hypothetical protein